MKIEMQRKKTTAGTVVFESTDPDAAVTTLYIRKRRGFDDVTLITTTIEAVSPDSIETGEARTHNYQRRDDA